MKVIKNIVITVIIIIGSIILISTTKENINNLNTIIDYIEGKGLKIDGLSKLITEELN